MDPVNIDFILGGNVDDQAPKTKKALDGVADAGKTAIEETQKRIQETKSNIAQVEADLKRLQKSFDNAAPGNAKEFFGKELSAAKRALEEEKNILGELDAKVKETAGSHARLRTQVMNLKDELAKLEMQGKRNTPEYRAMALELGRLNDQMGDTNMQVKILADDQKGFRAVASAASGMAGAMSAAVGVAALMGAENEELTKIQTRLQAVMAITIGLQQVSETLNKDSYFSVVLLTKAKLMWSATNTSVATTLGISTMAAKVLMITLTGGLIIAVTAAIAIFSHFISKQKEAAKSAKEFGDKTADAIAKPIAVIKMLSNEWNKLGAKLGDKQKYVDKNREAFKSLGIEINNVADAEKLLSDSTRLKAFQDAMMAKARAAAGVELATEKYKEALKKQNEVSLMPDKVMLSTSASPMFGGVTASGSYDNSSKINAQAKADELFAAGDKFFKIVDQQNEIMAQKLKESGVVVADVIVEGSISAIDAAIKIKKEALDKVTNKSDFNKIDAEIKALEKRREKITGVSKKDENSAAKTKEQLEKQNLKNLQDAADAEFKLMRSKITDKKDLLDLDYDQTLTAINRAEELFKKENPKFKASDLLPFESQRKTAAGVRDQGKAQITKDDLKAALEEYQSFLEKREKLVKEYNAKVKLMTDANTDGSNNDNLIEAARAQMEALDAIDLEIANRSVKFEAWVSQITKLGLKQLKESLETAQETLSNSSLSDDEKATLRAQIKMLTKKIEFLEAGGEGSAEQKTKNTLKTINEVSEAVKNMIGTFDGLDEATKSILTAASNISGAVISSIMGFMSLSKTATVVLKGVERASVILAIIGAAISVLSVIINLYKTAAKQREDEEKKAIERQNQEYLGLLDHNAELRKKYEWTKKIGEAELEFIKRKGEELARQSTENEKEQADLAKKLAGATYISGEKTVSKSGGIAINAKKGDPGTKQVDVWSSLAGKKYEEISELAAKGKLSEEGMKYYNALKKAKEEGEDIVKMQLEHLQYLKEIATGSTARSITDSIIQGFKAGKRSAADFAETFEQLMQGAVQSALSQMTDKKVLKWYDDFAAMNEDGKLTKEEKEELRKRWERIIEDTAAEKAALEEISGTSMSDRLKKSGISGDVSNMTEQTGTALVGQLAAMRLNVAAILATNKNTGESMTRMFAIMERIRDNTEYCRKLERIDENIQYLKSNGIEVK